MKLHFLCSMGAIDDERAYMVLNNKRNVPQKNWLH